MHSEQVGYDNKYLAHFKGNHLSAKGYVTLTWAHIQAYYCQPSLGSKIYVERLPGMKHYDEDLPGDDTAAALETMEPHTEKDLGSADLMMYMGLNCEKGCGIIFKVPSMYICTFPDRVSNNEGLL